MAVSERPRAEVVRPVLKITAEQWHARRGRGLAAVVRGRPYIVMMHDSTREPVYQPVAILDAGTGR